MNPLCLSIMYFKTNRYNETSRHPERLFLFLPNQYYRFSGDSILPTASHWLELVGAKHVIFTVGYLNRFRHPRPPVVSRYLEKGVQLYRSDHHGAVLIDFIQNHPIQPRPWRLDKAKYWHNKYL